MTLIGQYLPTGGSGNEPWARGADTTPALHERAREESSETGSEAIYTTGVRNGPAILGRPTTEITRPEVNPFAEALFVAGFLPDEVLHSMFSSEELLYERQNAVRVALLARKYVANEFSAEEEARLQIATERVRQLLPRATEADFLNLASEILSLNEIKREHQQIRKDAGLTK